MTSSTFSREASSAHNPSMPSRLVTFQIPDARYAEDERSMPTYVGMILPPPKPSSSTISPSLDSESGMEAM